MAERAHLKACLHRIEEHLGWGPAAEWNNNDYERLVRLIQEATGTRLSSTTLRRIWGALPYRSTPNPHTLNVLAEFAGYESWTRFKALHSLGEKPVSRSSSFLPAKSGTPMRMWLVIGIAIGTLAFFGISIGFGIERDAPAVTPTQIDLASFYSEPVVSSGVPNTVIFHYDVRHIRTDNVKIQQNWDARRQFSVDPGDTIVTSTYDYPGFWHAKLLVDDQVILQHDLLIPSGGWLGTIDTEPHPRYITEALLQQGYLTPSTDVEVGPGTAEDLPDWMTFHYCADFNDLDGDNFSLHCGFQNTYSGETSHCQNTQIVIVGTKGIFIIPFSAKGCVGDLQLIAGNTVVDGKHADLSPLGCNFSEPQQLQLSVVDKHVRIALGKQSLLETEYSGTIGQLKAFKFKFRGAGILDDVLVINSHGTTILNAVFDADL